MRSSHYTPFEEELAVLRDRFVNGITDLGAFEDGEDAPRAADDAFTTSEDTPLTVAAPGVLANDSDPNGDTLEAALETGPAHGVVQVGADGSFVYTPNANFNGTDRF